MRFTDERARIAILVSTQPHCLDDLLARWRIGELGDAEIPVVVSNHPDHADAAHPFGVRRSSHLPVGARDARPSRRSSSWRVLAHHRVDLVVLARYMQILTPGCARALPRAASSTSTTRSSPRSSAAVPTTRRTSAGVKLIGADRPLRDRRCSTRDRSSTRTSCASRTATRVADLARKGRDLERVVLARAVRAHLEHRVLVHRNKTVVFE